MATYAAFKHVELYNVGKAKKRVLKPPGGGSSDIFGGSIPSTPRTVRNNMASTIFAPSNDSKNGNGNADRQGSYRYFFIDSAVKRTAVNSHNRLFGEVERVPPTPKSYHKSNIPIGNDDTDAPKLTNGNGALNGNGNGVAATNGNGVAHENGNGHAKMNGGTNGHTNGSRDGNPVTGEGYKRGAAEINTTVPALNGAKQVINKNRIPPGGYSSGLW